MTTPRARVSTALWLPGLVVALGAVVATAHGLYAVALAAGTPQFIAGLYPVMTDGLAVVAYVATARLSPSGCRYAWTVVVLAAGLSGLAQAIYLAGGMHQVPTELRFGVGAWPAIAVAVVAHLLYLIAGRDEPASTSRAELAKPAEPTPGEAPAATEHHAEHEPTPHDPATVQVPAVQSNGHRTPSPEAERSNTVQAATVQSFAVHREPVQPSEVHTSDSVQAVPANDDAVAASTGAAPARDRAEQAAKAYVREHGVLPTTAQLMQLADVSRGSAGHALKALRRQPAEPHLAEKFPEGQVPQ
ncbi:hypothetical protein SAMN06265360_101315 [Haloechinothrix alba]|uniref:DUF2637 domain-containing protein n=1 Tax=Haloechinothrix alba TaxID=664784 RepID=A0A238V4Z9_9PSEU|nr:hypothetical protein [Haloechinothrix alba]SNR29164.1 hypothetical protein SAMN06265360_101315 [Haloechinothrix alba]